MLAEEWSFKRNDKAHFFVPEMSFYHIVLYDFWAEKDERIFFSGKFKKN